MAKRIKRRPLNIHLLMDDDPIKTMIGHVREDSKNPAEVILVEDKTKADLVISDNLRAIESIYSGPETVYGLIDMYADRPDLPDNIIVLHCVKLSTALLGLVERLWRDLDPGEGGKNVDRNPVCKKSAWKKYSSKADVLRILVVSSTLENQTSARRDFVHYNLTIAGGFERAMDILRSEAFDVVLSDLGMSTDTAEFPLKDVFSIGNFVPYGVMVMIEAAHRGAKHVAVVTGDNDHDDLSTAIDHFIDPINIDGARARMIHAPKNSGGSKDWKRALEILMAKSGTKKHLR